MSRRRERAVIFQVVRRIVRGADDLDLHFFQDALRGHFRRGEHFVGLIPDAVGGFFIEQFRDTEVAFQFEVRPVIKRVAQRERHGGGPGAELFARRGVAGDEAFSDAVGPQRAPFVMVAFEPDFKQVFELAVFRDVVRRNVAVIIENRLGFGVLVVESARGFCAQEKIFVDEGHKRSIR